MRRRRRRRKIFGRMRRRRRRRKMCKWICDGMWYITSHISKKSLLMSSQGCVSPFG
jgi:hypothetical protein